MSTLIVDDATASTPIHPLRAPDWPGFLARLRGTPRRFAEAVHFEPKPGRHLLLPGETGDLEGVVFIEDPVKSDAERAFARGGLASLLPSGTYRFESAGGDLALAVFAWLADAYRFEAYRAKDNGPRARLVAPKGVDVGRVVRLASAVAFGRDLINTPANDLAPDGLEKAVE